MQLVDTNIISELMNQSPNPGVLAWARAAEAAQAQFWISAVTVHEVAYGLAKKPNPRKLAWFEQFLARCKVVEVSEMIARSAGEQRGILASHGQVRHMADMIIVATARVNALSLITRNVRDFDGCGIAVLNPFTP